MTPRQRALVLVHGAALILLGLIMGLAAVAEELARAEPLVWRAGHNALLLAGVWLLGVAAVAPLLVLPRTHHTALCATLLVTAWAFATAIVVQAATGRALSPQGSLASWIAFGANIVTVGAGFFAGLLTLVGAAGALRAARASGPERPGP